MTKDVEPIYQALKAEIITLAHKPGTRLSEEALSSRFGVSRTPMRDVLKRLEEDQLLEVRSKSGTYVTKIDLAHLSDIMTLRTYVEIEVMSELMNTISTQNMADLRSLLAKQQNSLMEGHIGEESFASAFFACDLEFHKAIYSLAGKENLLDLLNNSFPYYQRYRYLTNLREKEPVASLTKVHGDLLLALENKDIAALKEISKRHNTSGLDGIKSVQQKHPDYFI